MSGKYLHDGFTLPCPPGLKVPEEDGYTITPNTLKVLGPRLKLQVGRNVLGNLVLRGGLKATWEVRSQEGLGPHSTGLTLKGTP